MVINVDNVDGGERSSSALTGQKSAATADLEQAQMRHSRDTGHFKKSGEDQFVNSKQAINVQETKNYSRQYNPKLTKTLENQIDETMQKTSFPTDFQKLEQLDILEEQDILGSFRPDEP